MVVLISIVFLVGWHILVKQGVLSHLEMGVNGISWCGLVVVTAS